MKCYKIEGALLQKVASARDNSYKVPVMVKLTATCGKQDEQKLAKCGLLVLADNWASGTISIETVYALTDLPFVLSLHSDQFEEEIQSSKHEFLVHGARA